MGSRKEGGRTEEKEDLLERRWMIDEAVSALVR